MLAYCYASPWRNSEAAGAGPANGQAAEKRQSSQAPRRRSAPLLAHAATLGVQLGAGELRTAHFFIKLCPRGRRARVWQILASARRPSSSRPRRRRRLNSSKRSARTHRRAQNCVTPKSLVPIRSNWAAFARASLHLVNQAAGWAGPLKCRLTKMLAGGEKKMSCWGQSGAWRRADVGRRRNTAAGRVGGWRAPSYADARPLLVVCGSRRFRPHPAMAGATRRRSCCAGLAWARFFTKRKGAPRGPDG